MKSSRTHTELHGSSSNCPSKKSVAVILGRSTEYFGCFRTQNIALLVCGRYTLLYQPRRPVMSSSHIPLPCITHVEIPSFHIKSMDSYIDDSWVSAISGLGDTMESHTWAGASCEASSGFTARGKERVNATATELPDSKAKMTLKLLT